MSKLIHSAIERLSDYLKAQPPVAIALSGGVDSLTLAWVAHEVSPLTCQMVHAVSPAVPPEATSLVKHYASKANWNLSIIDAHEYDDPRYKKNPVNRCYYCKTNLYGRIKTVTGLLIASGTNTDDLGDYRPGLQAAEQHGVIHPYVEANINKAQIRAIATYFGLHDVAVLPAQPCLASRVETGIAIDAHDLHFINSMESMLRACLPPGDIRCRITAQGIRVEIDTDLINGNHLQTAAQRASLEQLIKAACQQDNRTFSGLCDYRRGSAFIHKPELVLHTQ